MLRRLTKEEYLATFSAPMRPMEDVGEEFDLGPYAYNAIRCDVPGLDPEKSFIELVYKSGDGKYQHALIPTGKPDVYLVLVADVASHEVFGHYLIDFAQEYGLRTEDK